MRLLLFLFGLVLGVAGTLVYAMFGSSTEPPVATQPPEQDAPITLVFGKPFLDAMLDRTAVDLPGPGAPPTDLQVELRDGTLAVIAEVEVLGKTARGEAVVKPVIRDGKLRVDVVETNVGEIPLPAIEKTIEDQLNTRLRVLLSGLPVEFTGATVDRTRGLVVSCNVDPRTLDTTRAAELPRTGSG
jgi:hypothetical protein